jgi:hypothetical protein
MRTGRAPNRRRDRRRSVPGHHHPHRTGHCRTRHPGRPGAATPSGVTPWCWRSPTTRPCAQRVRCSSVPVVGITEAALLTACMLGTRTGVVMFGRGFCRCTRRSQPCMAWASASSAAGARWRAQCTVWRWRPVSGRPGHDRGGRGTTWSSAMAARWWSWPVPSWPACPTPAGARARPAGRRCLLRRGAGRDAGAPGLPQGAHRQPGHPAGTRAGAQSPCRLVSPWPP